MSTDPVTLPQPQYARKGNALKEELSEQDRLQIKLDKAYAKIAEHEQAQASAKEIFAEMNEEIEHLKALKNINTQQDPVLERFHTYWALSEQPPSNLVDLLSAKGTVERAAFLAELDTILDKIGERLHQTQQVRDKLSLADQLVR